LTFPKFNCLFFFLAVWASFHFFFLATAAESTKFG
jgi:hypothetical protein